MKTFLLVTEFFPVDEQFRFTGGVEARSYFTAKYLSENNRVFVICRKTKRNRQPVHKKNLTIFPVGLPALNIEANFLSCFERLFFMLCAFFKGIKLNFDLVEGVNFVSYLPAYLTAVYKNKPKTAWYADLLKEKWLEYFGISGLFGKLIEGITVSLKWDKIIALSFATKRKLLKAGVDEKKIKVVYGGVDLESFEKVQIKNRKQDKSLKRLVCISRLVKYKRVEDLIKAFYFLSSKYKELTLTIVGRGPEKKRLMKFINQKKLNKKVVFLENISRVRLIKLLKKSYLFCLPSIVEGFGLATIEAAACGIPFVISDIKVNREVTKNGQGGLFFKPEDFCSLAEKIEILIGNKAFYQKKQKQAFQLAQRYDWKDKTSKLEKIYKKTIVKEST